MGVDTVEVVFILGIKTRVAIVREVLHKFRFSQVVKVLFFEVLSVLAP